MNAGASRKNGTHGLLVDFAITSLEAAQDDLLDSIELISVRVVSLSDLAEIDPRDAVHAQEKLRSDPWTMRVVCRIAGGLPKEYENVRTVSILMHGNVSGYLSGCIAEFEGDPRKVFAGKKAEYNEVSPFRFLRIDKIPPLIWYNI